jgi:hypothetical protein
MFQRKLHIRAIVFCGIIFVGLGVFESCDDLWPQDTGLVMS